MGLCSSKNKKKEEKGTKADPKPTESKPVESKPAKEKTDDEKLNSDSTKKKAEKLDNAEAGHKEKKLDVKDGPAPEPKQTEAKKRPPKEPRAPKMEAKAAAEANYKENNKSATKKATKASEDDGETASHETDRLYKKYMAEVDDHAELRKKYFEDASKAHDSGDGKLAKELSEKGKAETLKMEEAKENAARAIYKGKNKGNEVNVMDLHGLQVEMALKLVEENLDASKAKGFETADVIHGKGNHSGADGPKVKGAIRKWLDENGYKGKWTEISDGGGVQVALK